MLLLTWAGMYVITCCYRRLIPHNRGCYFLLLFNVLVPVMLEQSSPTACIETAVSEISARLVLGSYILIPLEDAKIKKPRVAFNSFTLFFNTSVDHLIMPRVGSC